MEEEKKLTLIEQAEKAAQRLEEANKVMQSLVQKQEAIEARRLLGGQSEAGVKPVEKSKEEKDLEGMKDYFKGTALERAFQ